jgi:hypothetical protein
MSAAIIEFPKQNLLAPAKAEHDDFCDLSMFHVAKEILALKGKNRLGEKIQEMKRNGALSLLPETAKEMSKAADRLTIMSAMIRTARKRLIDDTMAELGLPPPA